jgi:hypothetical protein
MASHTYDGRRAKPPGKSPNSSSFSSYCPREVEQLRAEVVPTARKDRQAAKPNIGRRTTAVAFSSAETGKHENATAICPCDSHLDRFRAPLARADADAVFERQYKDLAVADFARAAGPAPFNDRVDRRLDEMVVDRNHQLHLPQQIDRDLMAAINLSLPLLPAEALHVHDRQPNDFDFRKGRLHVFKLAGLDNRNDELHVFRLRTGNLGKILSRPTENDRKSSLYDRRPEPPIPSPQPITDERRPGLGGLGGKPTQAIWGILLAPMDSAADHTELG